jgi:hypothetical protein
MVNYIDWNGWKVFPDNVPLNRPGAYRFKLLLKPEESAGNYIGISGIRSGVAGRCKRHPSRAKKFENAVHKYGKENFLLTPLYYLTEEEADALTRLSLQVLEADNIITFNAVSNGYNLKASDGGVGPYGPEFSAIMKSAIAICLQDPIFRAKLVDGCKRGAAKTHSIKDKNGKSVVGVMSGKAAQSKLSLEERFNLQSSGGLAANAIKDPDGKSTHARRNGKIGAAVLHAAKDLDGKSIVGRRGGKRGAAALHSKVDDQGRSLAGLRWTETWHATKDERGKSANAVVAGRKGMAVMLAVKDADGVSTFARQGGRTAMAEKDADGKSVLGRRMRAKAAASLHKNRDELGRSLAPLKCVHTRDRHADGRFVATCPFCNPEGYQAAHAAVKPRGLS